MLITIVRGNMPLSTGLPRVSRGRARNIHHC